MASLLVEATARGEAPRIGLCEIGKDAEASCVLSLCSGPENVTRLPDDIISCFIQSLSARDLVNLELVNRRMKHVVQNDSLRWRQIVMSHWATQPFELMQLASVHAGGWRRLFLEKMITDKTTRPWLSPSVSELDAMVELIVKDVPLAPQFLFEQDSASAEARISSSPPLSPVLGSPNRPSPLRSSTTGSIAADFAFLNHSARRETLDVAVSVVIDGSSSVTNASFYAMSAFASSVASALQRTGQDAAVGVIQFNQQPRVELPLTSVHAGLLQQQLCSLEQLMGSTNVPAAVQRGVDMLSGVEARSRVLLLLTDGHVRLSERQLAETCAAKGAQKLGVRVFALGIGRDIDISGLGHIVSAARSEHAVSLRQQADFLPLSYGAYFMLRTKIN
mmetsp:Transcript_9513/g.20058  ORF Transcript_9513/g.20058 Transcript_9513/m.20058 type:complete len:391 (+) Transcript_9513:287-1459(+)